MNLLPLYNKLLGACQRDLEALSRGDATGKVFQRNGAAEPLPPVAERELWDLCVGGALQPRMGIVTPTMDAFFALLWSAERMLRLQGHDAEADLVLWWRSAVGARKAKTAHDVYRFKDGGAPRIFLVYRRYGGQVRIPMYPEFPRELTNSPLLVFKMLSAAGWYVSREEYTAKSIKAIQQEIDKKITLPRFGVMPEEVGGKKTMLATEFMVDRVLWPGGSVYHKLFSSTLYTNHLVLYAAITNAELSRCKVTTAGHSSGAVDCRFLGCSLHGDIGFSACKVENCELSVERFRWIDRSTVIGCTTGDGVSGSGSKYIRCTFVGGSAILSPGNFFEECTFLDMRADDVCGEFKNCFWKSQHQAPFAFYSKGNRTEILT